MKDLLILANLIEDWVSKKPDLDVLTFVSIDPSGNINSEVRTFQQLWDNGQRLAAMLGQFDMKKGDSFALVMANHPEFVELMIASSIMGTVFVPIDPRTKDSKLRYMLEFAECRGIVAADYAIDNVREVWSADSGWLVSLGDTGETSLEGFLRAPLPEPLLPVLSDDAEAPMQMLYTSGTTGDPKAILSPHSRFGVGKAAGELIGINENDRPYTGLSLTHANAQLVTLGCTLGMGLRGVISREFTKSRLWEITRLHGCTWFNLLGGMTTAIYASPEREDDADNPVRIVLSAGMPAAIWEKFADRFNVQITEFYGAAEGGLCFNISGQGPVGSCGKPPPNLELSIRDDSDQPCSANDIGEICFRNADGSTPVVKYYKKPEASTDKTRDGWLRMGDIGHVDDDGWLYFHHRKGGGLRRNGDFVDTTQIEKVLSENPLVDDVFVFGIPAANGVPGEKDVVGALVLKEKCSQKDACPQVFADCKKHLPGNYQPSYLCVVDEIPKTASEKPIERFLVEGFDPSAQNVVSP